MKLELTIPERRLKALRVQLIETRDGVILKRGRAEVKIGGDRAAEVVQVVLTTAAKGATRDEIGDQFVVPDRPAVDGLVRELEARRILVSADDQEPAPAAEESSLDLFYWSFGRRAEEVAERLRGRRITIIGVNGISRQLAASLRASGTDNVEVVNYPFLANLRMFDDHGEIDDDQWPSSLVPPRDYDVWAQELDPEELGCLIATSDFGGSQMMRQWNVFCVKHRCHFLPVVLQDLIGYVGPLVIPGETSCFECLRARENSHLNDPEARRAAEAVAFEGQAVTGFHPSMASILGDIAALELSKLYGGWLSTRMVGALIEVNLIATEMTLHKVLKVPRCTVCSALNTRASTRLDRDTFFPGNEVRE